MVDISSVSVGNLLLVTNVRDNNVGKERLLDKVCTVRSTGESWFDGSPYVEFKEKSGVMYFADELDYPDTEEQDQDITFGADVIDFIVGK